MIYRKSVIAVLIVIFQQIGASAYAQEILTGDAGIDAAIEKSGNLAKKKVVAELAATTMEEFAEGGLKKYGPKVARKAAGGPVGLGLGVFFAPSPAGEGSDIVPNRRREIPPNELERRLNRQNLNLADFSSDRELRSPGAFDQAEADLRRELLRREAAAAARSGVSYIPDTRLLREIENFDSFASTEREKSRFNPTEYARNKKYKNQVLLEENELFLEGLNAKLRRDRDRLRAKLRRDRDRLLAELDAKRRQERQRILNPRWEDWYSWYYSAEWVRNHAEWWRIHERIRKAEEKIEKRIRERIREAEEKAEKRIRKAEERVRKSEKVIRKVIRKAEKGIREADKLRLSLENNFAFGTAVLVSHYDGRRYFGFYNFEGDAGRAAGSALIGGSGGNLTLRFPRLKESVPNSDTVIPSDRIKVRARDYGDYNYVAWGSWSGGENTRLNTGSRLYREVRSDSYEKVRGGHWIYGQRLGAADIPRSGVARYAGQAMGFFFNESVRPATLEMNSITGDINMAVTFRDSDYSLSGSLNLDRNGTAWVTRRFNQQNSKSDSFHDPAHHFSAHLNLDANLNLLRGSESSLHGSFFGANAAEVGGYFFIEKGDEAARGVFRAKKQ